jgi:hypothetical protein
LYPNAYFLSKGGFIMKRNSVKTPKTTTDKLTAVAISVVAIVLVVSLALAAVLNFGIALRIQTAAKGEHAKVDGAMMSFFVNNEIMSFYEQYGTYTSYFSLDVTKDFRSQKYGDPDKENNMETMFLGEFEGSWYDYFVDKAKTNVEQYIIYADAAENAGVSLDDDDLEYIDSIMESIDAKLAMYGVSYDEWYGKGVSRNDVIKCYKLMNLASKYASEKYEELQNGVSLEQAGTYASGHKSSLYTADCLSFTISKDNKGLTDEQFEAVKAAAKAAADAIAEATSPEEFVDNVNEYKESESATESTTGTEGTEAESETETEAASETEEETLDYEKEYKKYQTTVSCKDVKDNALNDFLFGNSETGDKAKTPAKKNDKTVIEETGTVTTSATTSTSTTPAATKTYKVTVYFVIEPEHVDKTLTHNFAYLVTNSKADAEKFKAEFEASANRSGETFVELAEQYYEKMHADENHEHSANEMFAYDFVKKQDIGWFAENGSGYAPIDRWIEAPGVKDGDISYVIEVSVSTSSGLTPTYETQYAVIYFEKHDVEAWYATAQAMYGEELLDGWYKEQQESRDIEFGWVCDQIFVIKPFLKQYPTDKE